MNKQLSLLSYEDQLNFYEDQLKKWHKNGAKGSIPLCPRCNNPMESWDCWLVTGASCTVCNWTYNEGTGSIV